MPNNSELYNEKDNQPLKEKNQDVNENEKKFLGKVWAYIEYNGEITKHAEKYSSPILITQRNGITPLLGVSWLKELPFTIKKILLDETTNQSNAIHTKFPKLFETNHATKKTEIKIQINPGCYHIEQKARPIPYNLQQDVKKNLTD